MLLTSDIARRWLAYRFLLHSCCRHAKIVNLSNPFLAFSGLLIHSLASPREGSSCFRRSAMSLAERSNREHFRNYKRQEIEPEEDGSATEIIPVPTPSRVPLPRNWQSFKDHSGRVFYVDHETRSK